MSAGILYLHGFSSSPQSLKARLLADAMAARKDGRAATANLRKAVARKADTPRWTGPEDRTADTGPAETPNTKIAPSGALHAEGRRAAIARSPGAR